jgi:uncharacterized small protein (DUF1192 family)
MMAEITIKYSDGRQHWFRTDEALLLAVETLLAQYHGRFALSEEEIAMLNAARKAKENETKALESASGGAVPPASE